MNIIARSTSYRPLTWLAAIFIISIFTPVASNPNFDICLAQVRSGLFGPTGGTDLWGNAVADISTATGMTYPLCIKACGKGQIAFSWKKFSQLFSSWLLPYLALVSQLPFGANDNLENLISVLLAVGSPTLAAFSIAVAVLNGRWVAQRFASLKYPNVKIAVQALTSLQQSSLVITKDHSLLSSLIVLPENDMWWKELVSRLDYTYTWTISAVASVIWVVAAFICTVIDSFMAGSASTDGQGVGTVWLWLVPIAIGWLQVSPKCDSRRLRMAFAQANARAYVATPHREPTLASATMHYAISLTPDVDDPVCCDEQCTAPIYNYSRCFSWAYAVEEVAEAFDAASYRASRCIPVDPDIEWGEEDSIQLLSRRNRTGTSEQLDNYCRPVTEYVCERRWGRWGPRGVRTRLLLASAVALFLQWGTTGTAAVVKWFTPPIGLGCRSGSYLLYSCLSTLVWILLVLASILAQYSKTTPRTLRRSHVAGRISIMLRRIGKLIASCNAVLIVAACLLQFSNFYERCYCQSALLGRGDKAYTIIHFGLNGLQGIKSLWTGAVVFSVVCALMFTLFVNLFINPTLPE